MALTLMKVFEIAKGILGSAGVIALVTLGYQAVQTSRTEASEHGETRALLTSTTRSLEESKASNVIFQEQRDRAEREAADLRRELVATKAENLYSKKLISESEVQVKQLMQRLNELTVASAKKDPCAPERQQIQEIESKLAVEAFWSNSLQGERREEALAARDKKYEALNNCLRTH